MVDSEQEVGSQDESELVPQQEASLESKETESSPETAHVFWANRVKGAIKEKIREFNNTPRYVSLESPLDKINKYLNRAREVKL